MIAGIFRRTELMVGKAAMDALESAKVIVFGVGGVGSWCAESLVRTGIGEIAIVDSDRVCVTNVNRQLMATIKTAGDVKVDALKNRLHEINPLAKIDAIQKIYCRDTASEFDLRKYDYVIDAIDSLEHKALLIRNALAVETLTLYSSMGAALKMDPFKIRKSEFWKIQGDGLARALRGKFRKSGEMPCRKFTCVWSDEQLENKGVAAACGAAQCLCPKGAGPGDPALAEHEWCSQKARINGTVAHTTAMFGFALAGLVVEDIVRRAQLTE